MGPAKKTPRTAIAIAEETAFSKAVLKSSQGWLVSAFPDPAEIELAALVDEVGVIIIHAEQVF